MASRRSQKPPVRVRDDRSITASDARSSPRELIVIAAAGVELRASGAGVTSAVGADVSTLAELLGKENISLEPLFGLPEERMRAATESLKGAPGADALPDMSLYYRVVASDERLDDLAEQFRKDPNVEAAYVKPGVEPARLNDMVPLAIEAPLATLDFTPRQGYLNVAPAGVDARYAWTRPGGGGTGVRVIDIEGGWRFSHEDLRVNQGGVIAGIPITSLEWANHGTAVIGEISGDRNAFGITGIAPDANIRAVSIGGMTTAGAIRIAADHLSPGDIILIELQIGGPNGEPIPVEWWPDNLAAIQYAVARGVIVVEAAGNGGQNLDDPRYDHPFSTFPSTWRNPFHRNSVDSRAIVVGAGAPPSGHFGPDRSRLDFSNYGSMVDAQGWGREVVTAGYGDLQGGSNQDLWYTAQFSGTSSATPIVVGAIACVQGARRAAGLPLRTPLEMRNDLRISGTAQQASSIAPLSQRIGNRPNLKQLLNLKTTKEKEKEREKDKEVIKDLRDTDNFGVRSTLKNRTKDVRDSFKVREGIGSPPAGNVEDRVAALEESVQQLTHFIGAELRPDLTTSSLSGEVGDQDAAALSEELRRQAVDAKTLKDDKDLEKTRDR
jgi:subtilisin family serine protease